MGYRKGEILIKNEVRERVHDKKKLLEHKKNPYKPCTKLNIF
jgi:hypothetical protein